MKRFSNNSNIYNQQDIIESTSELGVNIFRKYANSFFFKSLIAGQGIILKETENFINISAVKSTSEEKLMISGITDISKPILQIKSITPIFLKLNGCIGDDTYINTSSKNDEYIGIHTHDDLFNISYDAINGLQVFYNHSGKFFSLVVNINSLGAITYNSVYNEKIF